VTPAPYALFWSGGKDSALALARARSAGLDIRRLITFRDAESGRVRFHATRPELIEAQAAAVGPRVSLASIATPWEGMEQRMVAELGRLRGDGYAGVVLGDIHLADVRAWYEDRVRAAGMEHVEPLWDEAPAALLAEFVESGGRAVVTCVDTSRLDASWLGRIVDAEFAADIARAGVDACGENGEYHTFAFAGPAFKKQVGWRPGEQRSDGRFLQLDLLAE
jgi:uncharacterized protein (TIGR00290 family)